MEVILNSLIIIFALIFFLSLYLMYLRRERKMQTEKPALAAPDLEFAEELGFSGDNIIENKEEPALPRESNGELPDHYQQTMIRVFNRDPNWLYAYWEVKTPDFYQNQPCLRIFSLVEDNYRDLLINHQSDNWYISGIRATSQYRVAIGYKKEGIFYPITYSNTITTPADRPSDIIDERWMTIEELSAYSYRMEINSTLSFLKSLKKRKEKEERNLDSFSFQQRD